MDTKYGAAGYLAASFFCLNTWRFIHMLQKYYEILLITEKSEKTSEYIPHFEKKVSYISEGFTLNNIANDA